MKFRIHPILIPVFIGLLMTGNISMYTIIFLSLLIHEAGHLIAAKLLGVRVSMCTIMPYGGELSIPGRYAIRRKKRFYVAVGGPIATLFLLILALLIPMPNAEFLIRIQLVLLAVNLLPFLPLDGGQALSALIEEKGREYEARRAMIIYSILFYGLVVLIFSLALPETLPYLLLASFLLIQNIAAFRYRKYEKALFNLKN